MGSNGAGEVIISGSHEPECSEATVEIKIKMLDSQTYTLRVDKCVPVPALKEQIATVTGVVSEQQRLICRGKVLKDDQLLSAYHVEDGHTLHLVVRQPIPQSSESFPNHPASDSVSNAGRSQEGTRVVVGTFNIAEQGDGPDGIFPDLSRIVSAVLGSFGMTNTGSAGEGVDPREPTVDGLSRTSVPTESRDSTRLQADQVVLPDSLTTLNEYLGVLRHEFRNVGGHNSINQAVNSHDSNVQESDTTSRTAVEPRGLPRPQTLVEVMQSTRQILMEQAAECLSQLSRQLDDQENVTDPSMRAGIQSYAVRAGTLLHSLGALLLELGRATMTLRMGQTPADTVVNAGPAVFISPSGPNPIMVQPLPFPLGTSFGTIPTGTVQPGSGLSSGTPGSGFHQRNVDIRIQTATGTSGSPSSTREPEIRVVPIRTVVAALPATVRRSPSDSSHRSVGLLYPVLARVQRVTSGNMNSSRDSQSSNEHNLGGQDSEQQQIPESVGQQQNVGFPGGDGRVIEDGEGFSTPMLGRLDQLLSSIFPGEQIRVGGDVNFHGTSSATPHVETTQAATNILETPRVSDEGILLSNFLHQIMPFISQNAVMDSNIASSERADDFDNSNGQASSTQGQEDSNGGTASRHRADPPSPPNSKRQRRE